MSLLDRFRRKGPVQGEITIKDLPDHHSYVASIGFTKVTARDSPFPPDDPGAPLHKCDYTVTIKEATDPESQPLTFKTEQPVGYYYLVLRVMLARPIHGRIAIQIENFTLTNGPAEVRLTETMQLRGTVVWPCVSDEEINSYGTVDELLQGRT